MTPAEAHRLLDAVRDGAFPTASMTTITDALRITGDIPDPRMARQRAETARHGVFEDEAIPTDQTDEKIACRHEFLEFRPQSTIGAELQSIFSPISSVFVNSAHADRMIATNYRKNGAA